MLDKEKWGEAQRMVVLWGQLRKDVVLTGVSLTGGQCPLGIHSICSDAVQPLPPEKLSAVRISWELKLMVTKSYNIRAQII